MPTSEGSCILELAMWQIDLRHFVWLPVSHLGILPVWSAPESTAVANLTVKTKSHSSWGHPEKMELGCLILNQKGEVRLDEGLWARSVLSELLPFER